MPKRRPMEFLRRLGRRMRARRMHLKRTRYMVASSAEISVQQLMKYETGEGHPPAATLYRIAHALGMSTSALLGETLGDNAEQLDSMVKLHADPCVGAVLRHMQELTPAARKSLQLIATAFAHAERQAMVERVEVMT